ncbi:hypothetical protein BKA93DRAFT_809530, partial [Sparassis latifolia]
MTISRCPLHMLVSRVLLVATAIRPTVPFSTFSVHIHPDMTYRYTCTAQLPASSDARCEANQDGELLISALRPGAATPPPLRLIKDRRNISDNLQLTSVPLHSNTAGWSAFPPSTATIKAYSVFAAPSQRLHRQLLPD